VAFGRKKKKKKKKKKEERTPTKIPFWKTTYSTLTLACPSAIFLFTVMPPFSFRLHYNSPSFKYSFNYKLKYHQGK
jgi:hypothetical protein